jgi:acyl carrier protein
MAVDKEKVREAILEYLEGENFQDDIVKRLSAGEVTLEAAGVDSMDITNIILVLESQLNVELPTIQDKDLTDQLTLTAFVEAFCEHATPRTP